MRRLVCHALQCPILSGKILSLLVAYKIDAAEVNLAYQKHMVAQHCMCMFWVLGYSTRSVWLSIGSVQEK
jgi:hypothetical protein